MFLGLTSLVRLLSGLDLHWHVGLFLAWLLQHLLLLTLVQGQFSTTGIWWNFSAQKFNNLVYACMHAPSCTWKRKILRSHVTCKIQSKTVETQEHIIKKHNTWLMNIQERKDKVDCGDDVPFGLTSSFCNTKLFSLLFVCWFYFIPKLFLFCFVDGIWTSLRIIRSLDVLLSHLSYEDQMKGQGTKQERREIHSLRSKRLRVISELRMTGEWQGTG